MERRTHGAMLIRHEPLVHSLYFVVLIHLISGIELEIRDYQVYDNGMLEDYSRGYSIRAPKYGYVKLQPVSGPEQCFLQSGSAHIIDTIVWYLHFNHP